MTGRTWMHLGAPTQASPRSLPARPPPGTPIENATQRTYLHVPTCAYTCLHVPTCACMCLHVPTCILLARAFVPLLVVTFRF